jgi:hypothetical protein
MVSTGSREMIDIALVSKGGILTDLHAHPSIRASEEEIRSLLTKGIIGLTQYNDRSKGVFTYECALTFPGARELEPGLGVLDTQESRGYFLRCQEILKGHHTLGVGLHSYVSAGEDEFKTLQHFKEHGGISALVHPYVLPGLRAAKEKDFMHIKNLGRAADVIEIYNALANNYVVRNLSINNVRAPLLAAECKKPGFAATDIHGVSKYAFTSATFISPDEFSLDGIFSALLDDDNHHVLKNIGLFGALWMYYNRKNLD